MTRGHRAPSLFSSWHRALEFDVGDTAPFSLTVPASPLAAVGQRVPSDVGHMRVGEGVRHLLPAANSNHETPRPEHAEVLRGERLGDPERLHQFVDAARPLGKLEHDGQPVRGAERLEQLAGCPQVLRSHRQAVCDRPGSDHGHIKILGGLHAIASRPSPPRPPQEEHHRERAPWKRPIPRGRLSAPERIQSLGKAADLEDAADRALRSDQAEMASCCTYRVLSGDQGG